MECGIHTRYNDSHGAIVSHAGYGYHNYGKNYDCVWRLEAPRGMKIVLYAEMMELEPELSM